MKKCKYHCDYGDGENCHYEDENGCMFNKGRRLTNTESMAMAFDDLPDIPDDFVPIINKDTNSHKRRVFRNMITKMYFDLFAERYVLEKDPYAPPERYVETVRGVPGVYIDHWGDDKRRCLDIAYTSDEYYSEEHDRRYRAMCEEQGFKATHLRYFTLPEEKFDEYVKRFGLYE